MIRTGGILQDKKQLGALFLQIRCPIIPGAAFRTLRAKRGRGRPMKPEEYQEGFRKEVGDEIGLI